MVSKKDASDRAAADSALPRFEDAIAELEAIVACMESGSQSLDESLSAYRRGAVLVGQCRQALASVQQQVRVLEADLLKPFEPEDDVDS